MDVQSGSYEFSPSQNAILRRGALWSGLLAWFLMGSAVLLAITAILSAEAASVGSVIAAAFYFIIGFNFRGAAASMRAVVETSGNDIDHLMSALEKLAGALQVMAIVFVLGVIAFAVAMVMIQSWMGSLPA
jgi:hypothetical protein